MRKPQCRSSLLVVHRTDFKFFQKEESFIFLTDSHTTVAYLSRAVGEEEEKGLSHWSLTWTALLKGSGVTDTSLLFVFTTPISLVTGACGEKRQSITVLLVSPRPLFIFPVSLSHSFPHLFLYISLYLNSFVFCLLFLSISHSHLVWISEFSLSLHNISSLSHHIPLLYVSLQHADSQGDSESKSGNMSFRLRLWSFLRLSSHTQRAKSLPGICTDVPLLLQVPVNQQSHNECYTVLCRIFLNEANHSFVSFRGGNWIHVLLHLFVRHYRHIYLENQYVPCVI